jgi:hypothetical protein
MLMLVAVIDAGAMECYTPWFGAGAKFSKEGLLF